MQVRFKQPPSDAILTNLPNVTISNWCIATNGLAAAEFAVRTDDTRYFPDVTTALREDDKVATAWPDTRAAVSVARIGSPVGCRRRQAGIWSKDVMAAAQLLSSIRSAEWRGRNGRDRVQLRQSQVCGGRWQQAAAAPANPKRTDAFIRDGDNSRFDGR